MANIDRVLRSNVKLRHLQLLVALDEFRHLGRAAEFLSLTQPAVSKSLAEIERMFGLDLFARSTRGTEPTAVRRHGRPLRTLGAGRLRAARAKRSPPGQRCRGPHARGRDGRGHAGALSRAVQLLKARSAQTTVLIEEGDLTRCCRGCGSASSTCSSAASNPATRRPTSRPKLSSKNRWHRRAARPCAGRGAPPLGELAAVPWVVPPPWASSRIKLNQLFYQHKLNPPADLIESASFLVMLTFMRQRRRWDSSRARWRVSRSEGLAKVLNIKVPIELPPVGLILMRQRMRTPACEQLVECLRKAAQLTDRRGR